MKKRKRMHAGPGGRADATRRHRKLSDRQRAENARPLGLGAVQSRIRARLASMPLFPAVAAACVLGLMLSNGRTVAQDGAPERAASVQVSELQAQTPASAPAVREADKLMTGDRIKVTFYGRDDLTAEYRVTEEGRVHVPTLGNFDARGQTPAQLEQSIRGAVELTLQRQGYVLVEIVSRQPVFVTGLVARPGSYPYSPGMAVIHATAVAGGTLSTAALSMLPTEVAREAIRLRAAEEELTRLQVRQARLEAERAGREKIDIPVKLVERIGSDEAVRLVAAEQAIYDRQREVLARQEATLRVSVQESTNEVEAYHKELANIRDQRKLREASLETVRTLSKRGLTTQQRLTDSEVLMATLDRDAQGAIANIARSRQNLERNARDLANLPLERQTAVERDLQTVDEQIAKLEATVRGSARIIDQAGRLPAHLLTQDEEPQFRYEVLRKNTSGDMMTIAATETTALLPGDVVRATALRIR